MMIDIIVFVSIVKPLVLLSNTQFSGCGAAQLSQEWYVVVKT